MANQSKHDQSTTLLWLQGLEDNTPTRTRSARLSGNTARKRLKLSQRRPLLSIASERPAARPTEAEHTRSNASTRLQLQVKVRGVPGNDLVREYVERRLSFATDRFEDHIERLTVELADANGPRGGADKVCKLTADLRPRGQLEATNLNTDFASATDAAARLLRYRISEEIRRRSDVGKGFAV
jgi:putative sigma-54 modulation protein